MTNDCNVMSAGEYRSRIASFDGAINSVITHIEAPNFPAFATTITHESPEDPSALLSGRAFGVKDNIRTAGIRTTHGALHRGEYVPKHDAEVVAKLRSAGAILNAKHNLHELALGVTNNNPHFGKCVNPWDISRIPGGSSGGSAAAVSADFCWAALGTDSGGSVRIPASFCGVSGLRPTIGRLSNQGVLSSSSTMGTVGILARSAVRIARALTACSSGQRSCHGESDFLSATADREASALRVRLPKLFFWDDVESDIAAAVSEAVNLLAGVYPNIGDVSLPGVEGIHPHISNVLLSEAAFPHRERARTNLAQFGPDIQTRLTRGMGISAHEYLAGLNRRTAWRSEVLDTFRSSADVLIMPTTAITAPQLSDCDGEAGLDLASKMTRLVGPWSFADVPALTIPVGFDRRGLPIGMQIVGRPNAERDVLEVAAQYQRRTNWHTRRPTLLRGD